MPAGQGDADETTAPLVLRFNPSTIEHLGSNMYSRLPNAVAELVANAYDADATDIRVRVLGTGDDQRIVVEDDGHGMSYSDLQDKYLRIGRNRRAGAATATSESGRRTVSGKKGLGKLALFGVGRRITVSTTREGDTEELTIVLDWSSLTATTDGDYQPELQRSVADEAAHGTSVTVSELTRTTDINPNELAVSLSRLFQYSDEEVRLRVFDRNGREIPVSRELRLDSIEAEFRWDVPSDIERLQTELAEWDIEGSIVAARRPLPTTMRGLTVYTNGRLANEAEFFWRARFQLRVRLYHRLLVSGHPRRSPARRDCHRPPFRQLGERGSEADPPTAPEAGCRDRTNAS